ncbi:hyccin-like isoform X2 [Aphidius gifuensis]|uniref:hyccin-like isoform X2 n=1 Tax=Aphidius gifuensis TaxID=684658 RepID=UPI001CDC3E48|nr:hyccin-like isoform X2 [Aphidius gifuensis]
MTESLVNEWLADCADHSPAELHTFANTLSQDHEIIRALFTLLEERSKNSELVDTVCNQLFDFYRSREIHLQRFTLQFVPTLIFIYLNSVAHGDIKNCRSVETLLIGLYNLEVVDKSGENKDISFRLPSLAMLSIYHEPSSLAPASLTESAVRRFEECNTKLVRWGPLEQVETLNAQNRLKIMTALLFVFNQQLSFIKKSSLEQLCKVSSKLVTQGFTKPGHHQRSSYGSESSFVPRLLPRIPISNQFILELLHGIYFSMYNDCWNVGCQAIEDIHNRICYDGYSNVLLVTNAIRNSISLGPIGQASDNSLGVDVALSPAAATPTISKSMITNASFRTKKLPDDLDVNLFEPIDQKTIDEKPQLSAPSSGKRRVWLRKHTQQSFDDDDINIIKSCTSSIDNSRRESLASSHGSPNRSSPKKIRDKKFDNTGELLSSVDVHRRRKDKDKNTSPGNESRLSAGARLYRVLEEQSLGDKNIASLDSL